MTFDVCEERDGKTEVLATESTREGAIRWAIEDAASKGAADFYGEDELRRMLERDGEYTDGDVTVSIRED